MTRSIAQPSIAGLGVAVPGPFDYTSGVSEMTHKLDGLQESIFARSCAPPRACRIPPRFGSSTTRRRSCSASGGRRARGHRRAVGVTLGTGIGSAFSDEGEIVRAGAEVPPGGELYKLHFRGSPVEETISSAALLSGYGDASHGVDVEHIANRAVAGEPAARRVFVDLGVALAQFLTPWVQAFGRAVSSSEVRSRARGLFERELRTELDRIPGLTVTVAEQLEDAPLLGAAYYATRRI